jgi:hypothetical protein
MCSANSLSEQLSSRTVVSGLKKAIYLLTLKVIYCLPYSPGYVSTVQPIWLEVNKWPRLCPCKLVPTYVNRVGGKSFARFCRKIPNIFGRRQDIKVLLMVLNFTFALVLWRKVSTNYIQNFVFSIHLNCGYFLATNFWKKSFCCRRQELIKSFFWKIRFYVVQHYNLDVWG